jgi:predicted PurR-regulated permease PerM
MLFPKAKRDVIADYMQRADDLIGHYLRGALTVALLQGIVISVLFSIMDIKYALLLGLLAAILDLVPYFGLLTIMVLSAIVATFSEPPILMKVIFALGSIGFLHLLEVVFLSPRIVGGRVGLHPLLIILTLLVFMYFLGFIGLLIAVPATALVLLFVRDWEARRRGVASPQSSHNVI